jgi:hypothetical protein
VNHNRLGEVKREVKRDVKREAKRERNQERARESEIERVQERERKGEKTTDVLLCCVDRVTTHTNDGRAYLRTTTSPALMSERFKLFTENRAAWDITLLTKHIATQKGASEPTTKRREKVREKKEAITSAETTTRRYYARKRCRERWPERRTESWKEV